jgi:hypothetical protein
MTPSPTVLYGPNAKLTPPMYEPYVLLLTHPNWHVIDQFRLGPVFQLSRDLRQLQSLHHHQFE